MDDQASTDLAQDVENVLKAFAERGKQGELPLEPVKPAAEAAPVEKLPEPPEPPEPQPQPQQSEQPPQAAQLQTLDDAAKALQRELERLRQSEQIQRQQQQAIVNAEVRRRAWLDSTPGAKGRIAELGVLHRAALEAGLLDTSPEYFSFLEQQLAALPAEAPAMPPQPTPTPEFFKPAPPPPPPAARTAAAYVSAPVSRQVPGSGVRPRNKTVLSVEEQEAARIAGVSLEEYGKQKLRYLNMKEDGSYRDHRGET